VPLFWFAFHLCVLGKEEDVSAPGIFPPLLNLFLSVARSSSPSISGGWRWVVQKEQLRVAPRQRNPCGTKPAQPGPQLPPSPACLSAGSTPVWEGAQPGPAALQSPSSSWGVSSPMYRGLGLGYGLLCAPLSRCFPAGAELGVAGLCCVFLSQGALTWLKICLECRWRVACGASFSF